MFGAKCKRFAYGPADASVTPSDLASLKSRMVLPFWCWLTQVVLEKRPLNGRTNSRYISKYTTYIVQNQKQSETSVFSTLSYVWSAVTVLLLLVINSI